jgi:hypothetical protein
MAETSKIPGPVSKLDSEEHPLSNTEKAIEGDSTAQNASDETDYPHGLALALILTSVLMAMFLVSLVSPPTSKSSFRLCSDGLNAPVDSIYDY